MDESWMTIGMTISNDEEENYNRYEIRNLTESGRLAEFGWVNLESRYHLESRYLRERIVIVWRK